jgi:hypothetical protein
MRAEFREGRGVVGNLAGLLGDPMALGIVGEGKIMKSV